MAKKKSESKSKNNGFNLTKVLGFKDMFHNEKLNFVLGCVLVCVAIYLILAFISYFSTGAADQSLIEDPRDGEIQNVHHEFSNTCGSIGAYALRFLVFHQALLWSSGFPHSRVHPVAGHQSYPCLQGQSAQVVPVADDPDGLGFHRIGKVTRPLPD